ncbi:glutathione-regulated potassium-efflux system [Vibrio ishigakensis]|uniref:Glutathione-regulated potassium-efflux system n=1 Tax=Vibrio ishigakensis TaxID=1481914 RepID=A0A0B8NV29_9VIBR|nr:glutathione-regulated potassium-efflux system [Vibrio ishigakensis]
MDYYKWLTEQQKQQKKAESNADPKSTENSAAAKKDLKRKQAEFRKLTAPIRKNITKLETHMDKLNQALEGLKSNLAIQKCIRRKIRLNLLRS